MTSMARAAKDAKAKAETLAAKGRHKRALAQYLRIGDRMGAAQMYEKLGQLEAAAEQYGRAGECVYGAKLLASLGSLEEAARMFAMGRAYVEAGELLANAQKPKEAAQMFEKGGAFSRAAQLYERAGMHITAARLFEKGGDREQAIRVYLDNDRKELAAKTCADSGDYARAAEIYEQMEVYREAAACYVSADMKRQAIAAYEKAGDIPEAITLCEELGLLNRAAQYSEQLGDTARAAELFREARDFASAGQVLEADHRLYDAARMYDRDKATAARAAQLYRTTYATDEVWEVAAELPVCDLALAPETRRVAVCLGGPEVFLFDDEGNRLWRFRLPMGVRARSVAVTANASHLAIGTKGRSVYLLDEASNFLWKREFGGEVRGVALAEAQRLVVAGCTDGRVKALTLEGRDAWTVETDFKVWHLASHQAGERILAGCGDGKFYLIDFAGQTIWKENTGEWVSRLSISPDGKYAAVVIGLDKLRLYDIEEENLVWQYEHDGILQGAEFWRDERLLVGSNEGSFMLDFNRRCLWRDGVDDRVMKIAASGDGQTVYFGHFERGLVVRRFSDCLLRAARSYEKCGMLGEAAALYEAKNELSRAVELYVQIEDYAKAAALADRLDNVESAADLYEKAGQFAEAAARFEHVNMIERAASCYAAAGNGAQAAKLLAQLGDAVKAAEIHLQSGDLAAAGNLFEKAGAMDKALDAYEKAAKSGKLTASGALGLGRLYLGSERVDDAIKLLQPVTRDPDLGHEALKVLAECFMNKGMYNLAADRYREALVGQEEIVADNIDIFYGLGCAYEQAGMYDEAREVFQGILVVDYYYKDVSGRLEHIDEMSSVFAPKTVAPDTSAPAGTQVTVPVSHKKRYETIRQLGQGGMGVVYLARDTKLDREVALKVLPSRFSKNDELRSRFVREARAVAALNHKNVVAVYDIGEEWGESYISMEYIEGQSFREILRDRKTLPPDEAVSVTKQIAEGLAAAHARGIIHRDIKPENIMIVTDTGDVKIMDFGLARIDTESDLTREGSVMGTWRYMAPEQVKGERPKTATDVYATGIILFEAITGTPPFPEGDLAFHHVNTLPPPLTDAAPDAPAALAAIVEKCLNKDPDERYADGAELYAALAAVDMGAK